MRKFMVQLQLSAEVRRGALQTIKHVRLAAKLPLREAKDAVTSDLNERDRKEGRLTLICNAAQVTWIRDYCEETNKQYMFVSYIGTYDPRVDHDISELVDHGVMVL